MRATFLDTAFERQFCENGYVHLRRYFDADEVAALRSIHAELHPGVEDGRGFASDLDWADRPMKRRLHEVLEPYWAKCFNDLLTRHDSLISGFVVKWPGPEGLLPPHAHFSYVDPMAGRSIVVWVSLESASPERDNGPLRVLPKSHRIADEYFGSGTHPWYIDRTDDVQRGLRTLETEPGDVVVMDGRLVHGSDPNVTGEPRIAMLSEAVPAGLTLFHPVALDDATVELRPISGNVLADAEPGHVASIFAYYHAPEVRRSGVPAPAPLAESSQGAVRCAVRTRELNEQLLAEVCGTTSTTPASPGLMGRIRRSVALLGRQQHLDS